MLAPLCVAGISVFACAAPSIEGDDLGDLTVPGRVRSDQKDDAGAQQDDPPTVSNPPVDSGAGDAADAADAAKSSYRAFASSGLYTGNLGGIAGADAKCQALATAKGFTGTFKAWLSVTGTNAATRITANGPWVLPSGLVLAKDRAQLISGTLENPPNKDENNATLPLAEDRIWTASSAAGVYTGPDCNGWTGGGNGLVGEAEHKNSQWTALGNEDCGQVNRIYCFEN